jgi:(E)-4-hydroxy-3-methyl-but-2-enyl pyrophosphate reductase
MKVILAKTSGFCMGVRRAMNSVLEATHRSQGNIYTLGPLVHNTQAMEMLGTRRVRVVKNISEVDEGTLFIRAHGITPEERRCCEKPGVTISDMTCPHVRHAQNIIQRHAKDGFDTIIVGDKNHAEVIGLLGHADGRGHVISSAKEVASLPELDRVCLVAQTTQSASRFGEIVAAVKERFPRAVIKNTICSATDDRQNEVHELAGQVDAMIVVGGQHSANTVRLADIARAKNVPTFHIETALELNPETIRRFKTIGVTAGASTPHWVFQSVVERINGISQTRSALRRVMVLPFIFGVHTYLYLGAGSAAMTYATLRFLDVQPRWSTILLSFLYVVSMHLLNRLTDRAAAEINNPLRMLLYRRLSPFVSITSIATAGGALLLAGTFGVLPAALMGASLIAGIGYNVGIFPGWLGKTLGFHRFKELRGSKDLFAAAAWATVTVLLPCLIEKGPQPIQILFAFLFVFLIVFIRFLLFDLKDIEGDRLVGNETLPLLLGRARTGWLLVMSVTGLAALTVLNYLKGPETLPTFAIVTALIWSGLCALLHFHKRFVSGGLRFELIVDAQFIVLGLLARFL